MKISATVKNKFNNHEAHVQTGNDAKSLQICAKATGFGSSINGGELLMLALATCFCNDLYREGAKRNIVLSEVEVVCSGEFGAEGEPGSDFTYTAHVVSEATDQEIKDLIAHTDRVAEIHNTLRKGLQVTLTQ